MQKKSLKNLREVPGNIQKGEKIALFFLKKAKKSQKIEEKLTN